MLTDALVVFTAKTIGMILEHGGTRSWVLSPASMRDVRYVVCTRNSDRAYDDECGPRPEAHGEAFLVGRVAGLQLIERRHGRNRYLVAIDEYALVSVPGVWTMDRNPTRYTSTSALKDRGLDVDALEWVPMPKSKGPTGTVSGSAMLSSATDIGLTIAQAKAGLAIAFAVPEKAIQITING